MITDPIPNPPENTNPDISSSDSKIIQGIIVDLRTIIDQLAINFNTAKTLILELARRFDETKRCEESQICRKIKEILQDKIKEGKITEKWIEECLPAEYKRRYDKSEVSSLSKQAKKNAEVEQPHNRKQILVEAQGGNSILTNTDSRSDESNTHNDDGVEKAPQIKNEITEKPIEENLLSPASPTNNASSTDNRISPSSLSAIVADHKQEQATADIIDFEFSLSFGEIGGYIGRLYDEIGDAGDVWFSGRLDINTGKVIEVHIGRKRIGSLNDDSVEHE